MISLYAIHTFKKSLAYENPRHNFEKGLKITCYPVLQKKFPIENAHYDSRCCLARLRVVDYTKYSKQQIKIHTTLFKASTLLDSENRFQSLCGLSK